MYKKGVQKFQKWQFLFQKANCFEKIPVKLETRSTRDMKLGLK